MKMEVHELMMKITTINVGIVLLFSTIFSSALLFLWAFTKIPNVQGIGAWLASDSLALSTTVANIYISNILSLALNLAILGYLIIAVQKIRGGGTCAGRIS